MARTVRTSLLVLLAGLAACTQQDDPSPSAHRAGANARPAKAGPVDVGRIRGGALARDATRDVPTLWAATPAAPAAHRYVERGVAAETAAREQLASVLPIYHASEDALDAARVLRVHDTGRGPVAVVLRQSVGGIDLLHRDVKVLLRRDLELVAIGGSLRADARRSQAAPDFATSPEQAVASALSHVHGVRLGADALRERPGDAGGYQRYVLDRDDLGVELIRPARARKVLDAAGAELAPAYHVEIVTRVRGGGRVTRALVVDAASGHVLRETDLTQHEAFDYRVWARPDGSPVMPFVDISPHPTGTPDGDYPAFIDPSLVTQEGFNQNPDGEVDPWLAADATETRGNNVDAYTDGGPDGFDDEGDLRAAVSGEHAFDRVFDTSADPMGTDDQRMASVTQLFYTNNWLHDVWYDAGFDEAAGNAQADNFGRGGADGDPLQAQAQDDAPNQLNNANMYTPEDGESPVMQMYLFDGRDGAPYADSGLDVDVVAHEWGHYLHHRLNFCEEGVCHAESEGWGDFLSLHTAVREGDDLDGTYGMGAYASGIGENAAYFGIRQFPYSRDLERNGLTFKHIQDSETYPDDGPSNLNGFPPSEVHNAGEVWAAMMWQAYSNLLVEATGPSARYGFDEARARMAEYVVAGLTLAPTDPTFTEQRDAILLAAQAVDSADALLLAEGFATRGAGSCAVSPPRDQWDNEGVVESFAVGSNAQIARWSFVEEEGCDDDGYLDRGERGRLELTVRNDGFGRMVGATFSISEVDGRLVAPEGAEIDLPELGRLEETTVSFPVVLADSVEGLVDLEIAAVVSDPGGCTERSESTLSVTANADEGLGSFDPVETAATSWTTEAPDQWSRGPGIDSETAWHGLDLPEPSNAALVSPPIHVATNSPFILSFTHQYSFEQSYDGGVIEISRNDGASWQDVSAYVDVPYTGNAEALSNRPAFNGYNPSYPESDDVTLSFGIGLAGDTIRLRFRIGTDSSAGYDGWYVDDISVIGAAEPPFIGLTDDATDCGEGGSGQGGGGGDGGAPATSTGAGPTTSGVGSSGQGPAAGVTSGGTPPRPPGGDANPDEVDDEDEGCDCRTTPGSEGPRGAWLVVLGAVGLAARNRRRRD